MTTLELSKKTTRTILGGILSLFAITTVMAMIPSVYGQVNVQGTVQIVTTCGIGIVSGSPINYGSLSQVNEISAEQTLRIENTGRGQETVLVRGTAWTDGGTQMPVGATHYSATSGQSYASKSALTGSDTTLTTLNNRQQKDTFWQLQAALTNPEYTGSPSQTVTITGQC